MPKAALAVAAISAGILMAGICISYDVIEEAFAHALGVFTLVPTGYERDNGSRELGGARDIVVGIIDGKPYAFVVSTSDDGLQVMNLTDPTNPDAVGELEDTSGVELWGARSIALYTDDSNHHYVAVAGYEDDGIEIINVTNPASPDDTDSTGDSPSLVLGRPAGIDVYEYNNKRYAAVASKGEDGIQLLDITDPDNAIPRGNITDAGPLLLLGAHDVKAFMIDGLPYAAVAAHEDNSVQVLNLTDHNNIVATDKIQANTGGIILSSARHLDVFVVDGSTYAIATSENWDGFQILDISDPANIEPVSHMVDHGDALLNKPRDLTVFTHSGYTYAAIASNDDNGIQLVDLSNPKHPFLAGQFKDNGSTRLRDANSVAVYSYDGNIYAAAVASGGDNSIQVLRMDHSTNPNHAPAVNVYQDITMYEGLTIPMDVLANDRDEGDEARLTYAWTTTGGSFSDETVKDTYFTAPTVSSDTSYTLRLTVTDHHGASNHDELVVRVLDDAANLDIKPRQVGAIQAGPSTALNSTINVAAMEWFGTPYVLATAYDNDALTIISVDDPANPVQVDSVTGFGGPWGLDMFDVSGTPWAVVTGTDDGMVSTVNVTDPTSPTLSAPNRLANMNATEGVSVFTRSGTTYAAAVSFINGAFQVFSLADPASPAASGSNATLTPDVVDTFKISSIPYAAVTGPGLNRISFFNMANPDEITTSNVLEWDCCAVIGPKGLTTFRHSGTTYGLSSVATYGMMLVISVNDPAPLLVANVTNPVLQGISDIDMFEWDGKRWAAAAAQRGDLIIFDMDSPTGPVFAGNITTGPTPSVEFNDMDVFEHYGNVYAALGSVNDGGVHIIQLTDNRPPTVDAGPDRDATAGDRLTLDISISDPDSTLGTIAWGHNSTLTFTSPVLTTKVFNVTVPADATNQTVKFTVLANDVRGALGSDSVLVKITARPGPDVDAGPDKSATEGGDTITLEGSATDPNGHTPLTYMWTHNSTLPITLGNAAHPTTGFRVPDVTDDTPVLFTLTVTNSQGGVGSDTMLATFLYNRPPVVDAGPDQRVPEGSLVTLNGTATDPEGHTPLTYEWGNNFEPNLPPINIADSLAINATFTAPQVTADTTYTVFLVATDSRGATAIDEATITVYNVPNQPPVVDAGPDLAVPEGQFVSITATAEDPEGNTPLTYRWSQHLFTLGAPVLDMAGSDTPTLTFTAPPVTANSTYSLHFSATDSLGEEALDVVRLLVYNVPSQPPEVYAGPDQSVSEGDRVTLNGTARDPEGEGMTYLWSCEAFERGPDTTISLDDPSQRSVRFTAPQITPHVIPFISGDVVALTCTFTATDIRGESASDTMTLLVRDVPAPANTLEDGPVLTLAGSSSQKVSRGSTYVDPGATCVTLHDGVSLTVKTVGVVDTARANTVHTIEYSCEHNGRTASDTRTVTITFGNERPHIAVTSFRTAIGAGDGSTDYGSDATCTDFEDGGLLVTSSVSFHGDGTATITYSCTDSGGRTSRTTQSVAVTSSSPPGIHLKGPSLQYVKAGDTWTDPGAYCIDAEDGRISASVTSSNVDTTTPGHYTVGYSCTDSDGNSKGTIRNVLVQPSHQNLPPSLSVGSRAVTVPVNGTLSLPSATCHDREDGDLTHLIWLYGVNDVNTARAGTYDVFYFCTDSEDEKSQAYLRVVVVEP